MITRTIDQLQNKAKFLNCYSQLLSELKRVFTEEALDSIVSIHDDLINIYENEDGDLYTFDIEINDKQGEPIPLRMSTYSQGEYPLLASTNDDVYMEVLSNNGAITAEFLELL